MYDLRSFSLWLVQLNTASTTCSADEVYANVIKKTTSLGTQESFWIYSGTEKVYTSPKFTNNNTERQLEICLPLNVNHTYSLKMVDAGNSWSNGAWIQIQGVNGNIVFKGMMVVDLVEGYDFALYSPINKGSDWKYIASVSGLWKQVNYQDNEWSIITTGDAVGIVSGTQYFRHLIANSLDFAAFELQFHYRFGIVAYINGEEVYRDNMPDGEVQSATLATGSYSAYAYRGVVRPADLIGLGSNVVAAEVHFTTANYEEVIQFNSFLSFLSGISEDNKCFVFPYTADVTSDGFSNPENAFSYTFGSKTSSTQEAPSITTDYSSLSVVPLFNAIRIWPYTGVTTALATFDIDRSSSPAGSFTAFMKMKDVPYTSKEWNQIACVTPSSPSSSYRLTAYEAVSSNTKDLYELQYLICNVPTPTSIDYSQEITTYFRNYEVVDIRPTLFGITNCQVTPALPTGLVWNSAECSLAGSSTELLSSQVFSVTGYAGSNQITGTFTLSFVDCLGSLYKIVRTYKAAPEDEYFRIYDTSTMTTIYEIQAGHSHKSNYDWEYFLCITVDRFDVNLYSTTTFWVANSYFYLYYILPNDELEMVMKGRYDMNENTDNNMYARCPHIGHSEQWHYKFDSVPSSWYSLDMTGWNQASRGSFPTANNKIQLYKKTFTIASLNEVKGFILSIRYRYGCVVYMNGHEAWRNGVEGEVTVNPTASNSYSDLRYRVVSLPGKTVVTSSQPIPVNYLQQGLNTIAIALIALTETQLTTDFDCIVRLMPSDQSEGHIWEFTGSTNSMNGNYAYPFSKFYSNTIYSTSSQPCFPNFLSIKLDNDRREWISSVHIQSFFTFTTTTDDPSQFQLYARNSDDDEWLLLKNVTGLTWSIPGQKQAIYFRNNHAYNQFKFENIFPADYAVECKWRVQSFNLVADNPIVDPAPLTYPSSVVIFKDIEISEIIPTGDGYFDFSISPDLPEGLSFDPHTGWVSGTTSALESTTVYTVTASKFTNGTSTTTFSISIALCTGGRSLITIRFRADGYPEENSWKLYNGRGTSGTVLQQVDVLPVKNAYYYLDFCLNDGIYTFQGLDSDGDGWATNTGYTLTADVGAMELEIQEMNAGTTEPLSVSTVFSSYFPFQIEYTDWHVYQDGLVVDWNTISFDDSTWMVKKAAAIPITQSITTYIRKPFTLTNSSDYQVLNVRIRYSGGIACYLNGNPVARFNLIEEFDENTESITIHDATLFSKFHIILPISGRVEGLNVIAFEVHRPRGTSSSEPVVFDATGVFGVDDCSIVLDSYALVESTTPSSGSVDNILDLNPYTTGNFPNLVGTYMEWTVENLMGSKWNSLNIYTAITRTSWGFDILATMDPTNPEEEATIAFQEIGLTLTTRTRPNFPVPVALAGFRRYRWEVTDTSTGSGVIGAFFQCYCKATGSVCPAVDLFPSVSEGQISPSSCPEGYRGYSYRICSEGQLGEIMTDRCTMKEPVNAHYQKNSYEFVMGTAVSTNLPSVKYIVTRWYVDDGVVLPEGLTLNESTGEIIGVPSKLQEMTSYTIYAENASGAASTIVSLTIRKGQCLAEGVFPLTEVDNEVVYECSQQGAYVGTQKRVCKLGLVDGEWQPATGSCTSITTIVIGILVGLVVIIVVVFIVMRASRKAKAVGGKRMKPKSGEVVNQKKEMTTKKNTTMMKV